MESKRPDLEAVVDNVLSIVEDFLQQSMIETADQMLYGSEGRLRSALTVEQAFMKIRDAFPPEIREARAARVRRERADKLRRQADLIERGEIQ